MTASVGGVPKIFKTNAAGRIFSSGCIVFMVKFIYYIHNETNKKPAGLERDKYISAVSGLMENF